MKWIPKIVVVVGGSPDEPFDVMAHFLQVFEEDLGLVGIRSHLWLKKENVKQY